MKWTRKASAISRSRAGTRRSASRRSLRSICAETQLPSRQARGRIERPADVDILIMPGRGVAEPLAERLDAVGPELAASIVRTEQVGVSSSRDWRQQPAQLGAGLGADVQPGDPRHHLMAIFPPGRSRRGEQDKGEHASEERLIMAIIARRRRHSSPIIETLRSESFVAVDRDRTAGGRGHAAIHARRVEAVDAVAPGRGDDHPARAAQRRHLGDHPSAISCTSPAPAHSLAWTMKVGLPSRRWAEACARGPLLEACGSARRSRGRRRRG